MMYEELEERLKKEKCNLNHENYADIETAYTAMNFDKDVFAKIVESVGIETIVSKRDYFKTVIKGIDLEMARKRYIENEEKIERYQKEVEEMKEFNKHYQKQMIY